MTIFAVGRPFHTPLWIANESCLPARKQAFTDTAGSDGQRVNLQFDMGSAAEVDGAFDQLTASGAGVYKEPWDAFWGQRFARVLDLDGNVVSLFAEL